MTDDLVKRLRKRQEFEFIDGYKRVEWEDEDALAAADRIEELEIETRFKKLQAEEWACYRCEEKSKSAADEIERLTKKCDMQAMILRRLTPENHPDTLFIHGTLGDKDHNNMPEKLQVVPAFGVDFSYIYERTKKTTGPEW
jgi:hypothetical protein